MGSIYNGVEDSPTGDSLSSGTDVLVMVNKAKCIVTFILRGGALNDLTTEVKGRRQYKVKSPILGDPER